MKASKDTANGVAAGWLIMATIVTTAAGADVGSNVVDPQTEARVAKLLEQMTLEEKNTLLYGKTFMELHGIARLGIPELTFADGPLGIRWERSTAFPAAIALGATWDVDLARAFGTAIAKEWRNKGRRVWLGPCIAVIRVPHGGRNFETFSEDPYLNSRLAVAMIKAAQSRGVMACPKHFAVNNQELDRFDIDIQVDERTLHELYFPAFRAAVTEAGAWAVMASYNRVNGLYATASDYLQNEILKERWGFRGFVVSDWGAVHDTVGPANAGLDIEMDLETPVGKYWGDGRLAQAVRDGAVAERVVDDKVRRVLRAMIQIGVLDDEWQVIDREMVTHRALARRIARDGIVLLKNDRDLLPLSKHAAQKIAVIGPNHAEARTGGGGSSQVGPYYAIGPLDGLRGQAGHVTEITSAYGVIPQGTAPPAIDMHWLTPPSGRGHGLEGQYFDNLNLEGSPAFTRIDPTVDFSWGQGGPGSGIGGDNFSVRWRGTLRVPETRTYRLGTATDDGARLYLDGKKLIDDWNDHALILREVEVALEAGRDYELVMEYYERGRGAIAVLSCQVGDSALDDAIALAGDADVAIVCVGLTPAIEGEGADRPSIDLDDAQVKLIREVAAANPNTVVVIIAGSQVGMAEWIDDVPCVMQAWYGGQEAGNAIADVVFGNVCPSGKLPMSFVRHWEEHPCSGSYPGNVYSERLLVGYRGFDTNGVEPLFPFGFGLSYTDFTLTGLDVRESADGGYDVHVTVRNDGQRAGGEVVQCYVHDVEASVARPEKELKGFAKVFLEPGQSQKVTITLGRAAFAFYDVSEHDWRVEEGAFDILVGVSSRDIRLRSRVTCR